MKYFLIIFTISTVYLTSTNGQSKSSNLLNKNQSAFYGYWTNESFFIMINEKEIALQFNKSCESYYPYKTIDNHTFELIWANNFDCVFDHQLANDFGVKNAPEIGKPFAKYKVVGDNMFVEYYYPEWVNAYSESFVDMFTDSYSKFDY